MIAWEWSECRSNCVRAHFESKRSAIFSKLEVCGDPIIVAPIYPTLPYRAEFLKSIGTVCNTLLAGARRNVNTILRMRTWRQRESKNLVSWEVSSIQPKWYCLMLWASFQTWSGVSIRMSPGKKRYRASDSGTEVSLSVEEAISFEKKLAHLRFLNTALNETCRQSASLYRSH